MPPMLTSFIQPTRVEKWLNTKTFPGGMLQRGYFRLSFNLDDLFCYPCFGLNAQLDIFLCLITDR
jgi:hypothetical protein